MNEPGPLVLCDLALSRRLETTEARASAGFVEAHARLAPAIGATWREVGGTFAMFDGPASPVTQTFRLGMTRPVDPGHLDEIEAFYRERRSPVFHEVSPLADPTTLALLTRRGYQLVEFTSVMFRPLSRRGTKAPVWDSPIRVRSVTPADIPTWIETAVAGWSEQVELNGMMRELSTVIAHRQDGMCFLAELDGQPVATGGLYLGEGVALFAGASTVPAARQRGAQLALLEHRLQVAADAGCDVAMMCALPGSGSQRNAERHGFRIAYTRIKWTLPPSP